MSFSPQCEPAGFHWNLNESKSLQVSRTLLSTLATLLWSGWSQFSLWFTIPPIFFKPLKTIPSASTTIGFPVLFMVHSFFLVLKQGPSICLYFPFLLFSFYGPSEQQKTISSFFLVNQHQDWSSGRDWVIRLYLKILENFMCLTFLLGFWFVHKPLGSTIKF